MGGMRIGYARVSTADQRADLQLEALEGYGCERVVWEEGSGAKSDRPGLGRVMDMLREGDVLVVWRLDRLGRSLKDLIAIVNTLGERGVGFVSLTEAIDTTSAGGRLAFHIFGALAEFEREIITERTRAGLRAARARGRMGGRPRALDARREAMAQRMLADPDNTVVGVAEALGVSPSTLYRRIGRIRPSTGGEEEVEERGGQS